MHQVVDQVIGLFHAKAEPHQAVIRLDIPPADSRVAIRKDNGRGALHRNTQGPETSGHFGAAMNELGLPVLGHPKICSPPAAINPPPTISIYRGAVIAFRDGGQEA